MRDWDPSTIIFVFHSALFAVAVGAFYKYGDRSEVFAKSLEGSDRLMRKMRIMISSELREELVRLFENSESVPNVLLAPDGSPYSDGTYSEKVTRVFRSEAYRECLHSFVEENSHVLADYHLVYVARTTWLAWMRRLSWAVTGLLCWQAVMCLAFGFCEVKQSVIPRPISELSFVPSGILIALALSCLPFILRNHDRIMEARLKYDDI